ncbi:TPA: cytoskeleton protein RodZ [Photobacterium damselae]
MNREQNEERQAEIAQTPGEMLRAAREQLGYSQKDIANRLRLRLSVINDIEDNRFEQAQLATFTRGYVRSYAKYVGVDEKSILALLDQYGHAQPQEQEMQSFSRRTKREAHDSRIMGLTWILAAVFLGLTAVWWWQSLQVQPSTHKESTVKAEVSAPANEKDGNYVSTLEENGAATVTKADTSPSSAAVAQSESANTSSQSNTSAASETTASSEPATSNQSVANQADTSVTEAKPVDVQTPVAEETVAVVPDLQLTFSGDCWIDIKDANGKRLETGIKKAGDKLDLDGKAPFKIVLGAPGVVKMNYQGQPVDLSKYPAGRVARFKLPQ